MTFLNLEVHKSYKYKSIQWFVVLSFFPSFVYSNKIGVHAGDEQYLPFIFSSPRAQEASVSLLVLSPLLSPSLPISIMYAGVHVCTFIFDSSANGPETAITSRHKDLSFGGVVWPDSCNWLRIKFNIWGTLTRGMNDLKEIYKFCSECLFPLMSILLPWTAVAVFHVIVICAVHNTLGGYLMSISYRFSKDKLNYCDTHWFTPWQRLWKLLNYREFQLAGNWYLKLLKTEALSICDTADDSSTNKMFNRYAWQQQQHFLQPPFGLWSSLETETCFMPVVSHQGAEPWWLIWSTTGVC